MIEQVDQVDVSLQIGVLLAELQHYTLLLKILALGYVRQKTHEAQFLLFGIGEGRRFIQLRILKKFHSALFCHLFLLSILNSRSRHRDEPFSWDLLRGQTLLRLRIRAWSRPALA